MPVTAVGDMQLFAGQNMRISRVNNIVVGEDVFYFTDPQALLSSKHTGPILKPGHDDEIHNWSAYLMSYDRIEPHTHRWYAPPGLAWAELPRPNPQEFYNQMMGEPFVVERDPNEQARQERLAALRRIMERRRNEISFPREASRPPPPLWMP